MTGKTFRVTQKNFTKPAIYHDGKHYFLQAESLYMKDGVLCTTYCFYSRGRAKWQEDSICFTDKAFLQELLQFAVKAKVISEIPQIAECYLNPPVYLTNAICENVADKDDLIDAGLPFFEGDDQEDWYPLTKEEEQYIADDTVEITGYDPVIFTGYSVLYQNRKWLDLEIEISFTNRNEESQAQQINKELKDKAESIAKDRGFVVIAYDAPAVVFMEGDGNFDISILVPMTYAQTQAKTRDEWLTHVRNLFS